MLIIFLINAYIASNDMKGNCILQAVTTNEVAVGTRYLTCDLEIVGTARQTTLTRRVQSPLISQLSIQRP